MYNPGLFGRGNWVMRAVQRFVVSGRVQGVGFRFFVHDIASAEGLDGYARNLSDGQVEVIVDGELAAIERLHRALYRGPAGSRVEAVQVETLTELSVPPGFSIR